MSISETFYSNHLIQIMMQKLESFFDNADLLDWMVLTTVGVLYAFSIGLVMWSMGLAMGWTGYVLTAMVAFSYGNVALIHPVGLRHFVLVIMLVVSSFTNLVNHSF